MRTAQRKPMELFPLIVLLFIVAILRSVVRSARRARRGSWAIALVPIVLIAVFALPLAARDPGWTTVFGALLFVAFFSSIVGVLIALIRRAQARPGDLVTLPPPPGGRDGRIRPPSMRPPVVTPPTRAPAPATGATPRPVAGGRADVPRELRPLDRPVSKSSAPVIRPTGGSPPGPSRRRPPSMQRSETAGRPPVVDPPGKRRKPVSEQLVEEARKKYYRSR